MQMVVRAMKLGIDFGTTRIVVAAADRGNYPLAGFESPDGQTREWFPPLVAVRGKNACSAGTLRRYRATASGRCCARSSGCSASRPARPGGRRRAARCRSWNWQPSCSRRFASSCARLPPVARPRGSRWRPRSACPANANSNQRFLTAEAFRAAGFQVLGMLNEPSAASIEFGHRRARRAQGPAAPSPAGLRLGRRHLRCVAGGYGRRHAIRWWRRPASPTSAATTSTKSWPGWRWRPPAAAARTRVAHRCRVVPAAGGVPRTEGVAQPQYAQM